jgi:predicted DNA-binding transcriptional regulator YafY
MALMLLLQRRGSLTAGEAARELEVSVRTVYRDVDALQAAGVPIWSEPGARGGIRLVEGWRTDLDGLTGDEASALFLAGAPAAAAELGLGSVLAAAQAKVLTTLPPELRGRAGRIRERFLLDAPGWFHRDEPLPHLGAVAEAVWGGCRLDLRYRRGDTEVARLVDPLGLVLKAGTWYLVARSGVRSDGADIRTYRIGRLATATMLDERFERPSAFDLDTWWARSSTEFDRSLLRERVRLRGSPVALRLLPHLVGSLAAQEAIAAAGPPDAEGWRDLDLAVESEQVACTQLVGLGGGVEVLDPPSLRAALAAEGEALASRNRPRP